MIEIVGGGENLTKGEERRGYKSGRNRKLKKGGEEE